MCTLLYQIQPRILCIAHSNIDRYIHTALPNIAKNIMHISHSNIDRYTRTASPNITKNIIIAHSNIDRYMRTASPNISKNIMRSAHPTIEYYTHCFSKCRQEYFAYCSSQHIVLCALLILAQPIYLSFYLSSQSIYLSIQSIFLSIQSIYLSIYLRLRYAEGYYSTLCIINLNPNQFTICFASSRLSSLIQSQKH